MKAITKFLAAGAAIAAFASAAPAAAQYMPGYGNPYGYGAPYGNPYGSPNGYGAVNSQVIVSQCANAVQARLSGGYGGAYGGYGGAYGSYNGAYGGGRVLGISRVEPRRDGGFNIRGVATSGGYATYGYAPNAPNLVWRCRTDFRGAIVDIDVDPAQRGYGSYYEGNDYTPWTEDYSEYGYQRY
jgi:hypothetical protein